MSVSRAFLHTKRCRYAYFMLLHWLKYINLVFKFWVVLVQSHKKALAVFHLSFAPMLCFQYLNYKRSSICFSSILVKTPYTVWISNWKGFIIRWNLSPLNSRSSHMFPNLFCHSASQYRDRSWVLSVSCNWLAAHISHSFSNIIQINWLWMRVTGFCSVGMVCNSTWGCISF